LSEWPRDHVVKALCFYHPDDPEEMRIEQEATVTRLFEAARRNKLEFLLEVIPSKVAPCSDQTTASIIRRFYEIGIYPDWWKLEPLGNHAAWAMASEAIRQHDPHCRGIVVLGLDASVDALAESFAIAAQHEMVKGFAVGRTIFGDAAKAWLQGNKSDNDAISQMANRYRALCEIWDEVRKKTSF